MAIKFDKKNARIHSPRNKRMIRRSLEKCGVGRSILLDNKDGIIAGNGVFEQAQEMGLRIKIVESDGSELIAVKRTDIEPNTERREEMALLDNWTNDTSEFDKEILKHKYEFELLEELGIAQALKLQIEDDFTAKFDSYNDQNCAYPIVPKIGERHELFIICTDNIVDANWLREKLGMQVMKSYKGVIGESNVIALNDIKKALK